MGGGVVEHVGGWGEGAEIEIEGKGGVSRVGAGLKRMKNKTKQKVGTENGLVEVEVEANGKGGKFRVQEGKKGRFGGVKGLVGSHCHCLVRGEVRFN
jgi:hypothetical protein